MQEYSVKIKKGKEKQIIKGFPWAYSGEVIFTSDMLQIPKGALVNICDSRGQYIATGYFNDKSQITCRVLTRNSNEEIGVQFFQDKLEKALQRRQKNNIDTEYCRVLHSEADGVPGLIVDRFNKAIVCQFSTAGIERLKDKIIAAIEKIFSPETIILRNDFHARKYEGLEKEVKVIKGEINAPVKVKENECWYFADLMHGQKTGWFYDQRDNRKMMAEMSDGKTVADIFSHSGGFGIVAAKHGAQKVTMVDSSELALELARKAAAENDVSEICDYITGDAFDVMVRLNEIGNMFDVVLADPPAFVKSKKDIASGLKGYEKVARMAAKLVKSGGILYVASCSHHAGKGQFIAAVEQGVKKAGRRGRVIKTSGAAADHPVHPMLAQNEYLKAVVLEIT